MSQVNLMIKNTSGGLLNLELVDQYGGDFTDEMAEDEVKNFSLMEGSDVVVNGDIKFQVSVDMEGNEIEI